MVPAPVGQVLLSSILHWFLLAHLANPRHEEFLIDMVGLDRRKGRTACGVLLSNT